MGLLLCSSELTLATETEGLLMFPIMGVGLCSGGCWSLDSLSILVAPL